MTLIADDCVRSSLCTSNYQCITLAMVTQTVQQTDYNVLHLLNFKSVLLVTFQHRIV